MASGFLMGKEVPVKRKAIACTEKAAKLTRKQKNKKT